MITETPGRVITAIRITHVRWQSTSPPKPKKLVLIDPASALLRFESHDRRSCVQHSFYAELLNCLGELLKDRNWRLVRMTLATPFREETKGRFCKRAVWRMYPRSGFLCRCSAFCTLVPIFVPSLCFLYPSSGFWYPGTSAKPTLLEPPDPAEKLHANGFPDFPLNTSKGSIF